MAPVCKICAHPRRHHIDQALIYGLPLRTIAGLVGDISKDSLHRHTDNCVYRRMLVAASKYHQVARRKQAGHDRLLERWIAETMPD